MPSSLLYLGIMLGVIIIWFAVLKRPVYEAVFISFLLLLTITGTWGNVFVYVDKALSTSLLYSMVAFVAMSILLTKTKIIDITVADLTAICNLQTAIKTRKLFEFFVEASKDEKKED